MAPKTCVQLANAAAEGKWEEVRQIWTALAPVMSLIWQGDYVQSVYAGAEIMGYVAGNPRRPLARLADDKVARLRDALAPLVERESAL